MLKLILTWLVGLAIALTTGIAISDPVFAAVGWGMIHSGGSVGVQAAGIDVYPGCPTNPAAPAGTAKYWYFDAGVGKTPSAGGTGTQANPYNDPNGLTGIPAGWSTPIMVGAVWNHGGSIHSNFSATGTATITVSSATVANPTTVSFGATAFDSHGRRYVLGAHTFTAPGSASVSLVSQATGTAGNDTTPESFTLEQGATAELNVSTGAAVGANTLTFASLPAWVAVGQWVDDTTAGNTFAVAHDLITAVNFGTSTITLRENVGSIVPTGHAVVSGDQIRFNGPGVGIDSITLDANMTGGSDYTVTDPTHSLVWPGDVVVLAGTTQFPALTYGGASNISIVNGTVASPNYVWFIGDGTNTPHLSGLFLGSVTGVIAKDIHIDNTNPLSIYSGVTTLSNGVTFSRGAVDGDTFTVGNEVWTYTTGAPGAFQIGVTAGGTATQTASATATTLAAAGTPGALQWTSYVASGANITLRGGVFNSAGPLPTMATSIPQTITEAPISVGTLPTNNNNAAFKITGNAVAGSSAIYTSNLYVDAGQVPGITGQIDDYPMTGSLGIDEVTGLQVPAKVGGQWNSVDWIFQVRPGVLTAGATQVPILNATDPNAGVDCVTLANPTVKRSSDGYVFSSSKRVLLEGQIADYADVDNFVNANSNQIIWDHPTCRNVVDAGGGAHPDCWQGQSTVNDNSSRLGNIWPTAGPGNGWHDLTINGLSVYPASDTVLSSLTYTDFNGVQRPLASLPTGIQGTITAYYDTVATNNQVYSHNCPNLSFGEGYNLTIANNTVLWDGTPPNASSFIACASLSGTITVGLSNLAASISPPYNINLTNNVANFYNRGNVGETCNNGITFTDDRLVQSYFQGTEHALGSQPICANSTSGTIAFNNMGGGTTSWESGGLITLPTTPMSSIFTSFAPNGAPANLTTQFNATLTPSSPLLGAGTTCCGAPTVNYNGVTRTPPYNIGAY